MKLRRSLAVLGLLMLALQAEGLPRTPILVAGCGFAFPSVSPGSPIVGQVEIAHGGARAGNSYQWKYGDNGSAIAGATSITYTPVNGDIGHTLVVTISTSKKPCVRSETSLATGAVSGGGGGCTNSLNFAQACNSQYVAAIFH